MALDGLKLSGPAAAAALLVTSTVAGAADVDRLFHPPSAWAHSPPTMAAVFALKLKLPDGRGLARLLLDAGVNQNDAAAAARLAAGDLGTGNCDAKVEVAQGFDGKGLTLVRIELTTPSVRTTIERRQGELAVSSHQGVRSTPRLI